LKATDTTDVFLSVAASNDCAAIVTTDTTKATVNIINKK
jgi:hypothetical protein